MRDRLIISVVLWASILLSTGTVVAREKIVKLATLTGFPPYCYAVENSKPKILETIPPGTDSTQLQGYSWDVVRMSYHEMGYTIILHVAPWARVIHLLNSEKVDAVFPANRTTTREKEFLFSREYVDRTPIVVYVPAESDFVWQGLEFLEGLRVGAVREWAYGKKWEKNSTIKKERMDSIFQSFRVLDKKRIDAVIGYEFAYDYVLELEGMAQKYKKAGYVDEVDEYLMGNRGIPATKKIISAFDHGHRLLEKNGTLDEIATKWQ